MFKSNEKQKQSQIKFKTFLKTNIPLDFNEFSRIKNRKVYIVCVRMVNIFRYIV